MVLLIDSESTVAGYVTLTVLDLANYIAAPFSCLGVT